MRRRIRHLCQSRPRGPHGRQWSVAMGGQRQPPQGRGPERGPDRRAARTAAPAEGGVNRHCEERSDAAIHFLDCFATLAMTEGLMTQTMTGGCACGKVRFEATVEPDEAYLCHC